MTRAGLEDERSFLLASLEDLERERAVGDVSERDYERLRDRYTRRAAEVLRALEPGDPVPVDVGVADGGEARPVAPGRGRTSTRPPRRRRRGLAVAGVMAILAAVATLLVAGQATSRLPGQTVSGSVRLSAAQQTRQTLAQAETLEAAGDAPQALRLYQQVLARDPVQVEALSESGWLEFQAGVAGKDPSVLSRAQGLEEEAQRVDPAAYAPHLYLGSMLLAEGDPAGAVAQYRRFLADRPPAATVGSARPFITRAATEAGVPVPSVPAAPPAAG